MKTGKLKIAVIKSLVLHNQRPVVLKILYNKTSMGTEEKIRQILFGFMYMAVVARWLGHARVGNSL